MILIYSACLTHWLQRAGISTRCSFQPGTLPSLFLYKCSVGYWKCCYEYRRVEEVYFVFQHPHLLHSSAHAAWCCWPLCHRCEGAGCHHHEESQRADHWNGELLYHNLHAFLLYLLFLCSHVCALYSLNQQGQQYMLLDDFASAQSGYMWMVTVEESTQHPDVSKPVFQVLL